MAVVVLVPAEEDVRQRGLADARRAEDDDPRTRVEVFVRDDDLVARPRLVSIEAGVVGVAVGVIAHLRRLLARVGGCVVQVAG